MTNKELDLNTQNMVSGMLVQALLGAISPNFRMVALSLTSSIWQLLFVLEREDSADREEIEDTVGEFDGLLLGLSVRNIRFETRVEIDSGPLAALDPAQWRTVFRRRET